MRFHDACIFIQTCPYSFTEETKLDFDVSKLAIIDHKKTRLAMVWLEKWKTDIPPILRHDPSLTYKNHSTLAMYWVRNIKSVPPTYLIHSPDIQDKYGWTVAMLIIRYLHIIPPDEFIHDPDIKNSYGDTCYTLSLKYLKEEIPDKIKPINDNDIIIEALKNNRKLPAFETLNIDANYLSKPDGFTLAAYWIKYKHSVPPKELLHSPNLTMKDGSTCAIIWIKTVVHERIPIELLQFNEEIYDPNLLYQNISTAYYWILYNKSVPQKEILHDPSKVFVNNPWSSSSVRTLADRWRERYLEAPPMELRTKTS